ncbi:MAG: phosphatase PAP2 family protein [Propionicimonas sp.]
MSLWSRRAIDHTEPTLGGALRTIVVRGLLPSVALGVANVAIGRALVRRPGLQEREAAFIVKLQSRRTRPADLVARLTSTASDVPASILHGLVAVALIQRRTHTWRLAALPAVALILEAGLYLVVGALVNRERPDVPKLDREQPTSSFPSGHQGATVALMVVYALLAQDLPSPRLRAAIYAACLAYPATLAFSRVYVGMHYPSDVAVGTVNGLATGLLAWSSLHRSA